MVPNGWKEGRVRDLIKSLDAGVSVNSEDDGNLHSSHKILKTSCVSKGVFDPKETKSVVEDVEISRLKEPVLCDSIIISRMNTPALVGANGYIENGIENTYLPDRLWQAKPKSNDVNMKWLGYWFASSHTRYTLSSTATGTSGSMKNITKSDVLNIKIDIPPLPEQRKIAKILSTWDKAISTTERLIDNSKQQKKALMQQLLTGKKRLLDDSGKPFEGEWYEFQLGQLFKERVETGFIDLPLISITSNGGVISRDDVGRKDTSNKDKSKYRRICPNDIGYNTMRMWQGVSGLSDLEGIVSPAYTILIPQNGVSPKFASYLFKLPKLIHIFERNSQGLVSDTWNLKYPHFAKIRWHFPDYQEQEKIASVLINADKEIELLEQQLADLKQEKKALMQQLLTGKRRVNLN